MKNISISILLFIFLGFILGAGVISFLYSNNPTIVEKNVTIQAPEQALVLSLFDSWGENINNSNEVIFSSWVYNFGLVEAKNITLKCYVTRNGAEVYSSNYQTQNIGSESYIWVDIVKPYKSNSDDLGMCEIVNCDNCINLDKRVPRT